MSPKNPDECCAKFEPAPWADKEITWNKKLFYKAHVCSLFHIPLNYGSVMKKSMAAIAAAGAATEEAVCLTDEKSLWGADVYISVSKEIPGGKSATLTGTYLTKVFEGPYKDVRKWIGEMTTYVEAKGNSVRQMYFYYTTCPKCAKKYGKNYVVLLAQV